MRIVREALGRSVLVVTNFGDASTRKLKGRIGISSDHVDRARKDLTANDIESVDGLSPFSGVSGPELLRRARDLAIADTALINRSIERRNLGPRLPPWSMVPIAALRTGFGRDASRIMAGSPALLEQLRSAVDNGVSFRRGRGDVRVDLASRVITFDQNLASREPATAVGQLLRPLLIVNERARLERQFRPRGTISGALAMPFGGRTDITTTTMPLTRTMFSEELIRREVRAHAGVDIRPGMAASNAGLAGAVDRYWETPTPWSRADALTQYGQALRNEFPADLATYREQLSSGVTQQSRSGVFDYSR